MMVTFERLSLVYDRDYSNPRKHELISWCENSSDTTTIQTQVIQNSVPQCLQTETSYVNKTMHMM
jgi:hypothetical protein